MGRCRVYGWVVLLGLASCQQPTTPPKPKTDQAARAPFVGSWSFTDGKGTPRVITLNRAGKVTMEPGGDHGIWQVLGDRAQIRLSDGSILFLVQEDGKWWGEMYPPHTDYEVKPVDRFSVERVTISPAQ